MIKSPAQIMADAAALLNDQSRRIFTNTNQLAYFNLALSKLQEIFELNNIPVTAKTSASIEILQGIDKIGFNTVPALPDDLIEIERLWESPLGLEQWTQMTKKDYLPHDLQNGTTISQFLIWAWMGQEIKLIAANADNEIKIDYISALFIPYLIGEINETIGIRNVDRFLAFETAALCAMFIGENETRAGTLETEAMNALQNSMQISIKGTQQMPARRRPFRASWKSRTVY